MTGSWEEAERRTRAEALRQTFRPFRVAQIFNESSTIRSFHLEPTDDAGVSLFQAGQHLPIRVRLAQEANTVLRTYTISTAPSDGHFRISVKRQGVVSMFLHDQIAVGDIIEAKAPAGSFTVDAREKRPLVLISGGVGITPMLAMLRHVVYEGLRTRRIRPTWFLHCSRTRAERPFDAEIAELAKAARDALRVVQVVSGPQEKIGPPGEHAGHIDLALLRRILPFDDYDFYLCGPAAMIQSLYDELREMRIPDDRIFSESFGPSALKRKLDHASAEPPLPDAATVPVLVRFAKSEKAASWEPGGATLLELAEAAGIRPDASCRGGSCGTCKTRVLKGQLTYAYPPGAQRQTNEALICCALPAATDDPENVIVLDL
jgi:ferredoxin-NADP reductase